MGEGVVKTFKRLQYDFGIKKPHYATVGGNPNAEIAMLDESNPLESNINWDTYVQACARASTPNVYKTAIQNLQASFPITNFEFLGTTDHKFSFKHQEYSTKKEGYTYRYAGRNFSTPTHEVRLKINTTGQLVVYTIVRFLTPSRLAVQDYFSKNERIQRDRSTRNNVSGGLRTPLKSSMKPVILSEPFEVVFCDSFRLPVCSHGGKQFRWVFLAVDGFSKFIWLKEISQEGNLFINDETQQSQRPQSRQTFIAFQEFVQEANNRRRAFHNELTPQTPYKFMHPKLIVHDQGSEFALDWVKGMKYLKNRYNVTIAENQYDHVQVFNEELTYKSNSERKKGYEYYRETVTPQGRSQFNSMSERHVKTIRRLFYSMHNSYVEQIHKRDYDQVVVIERAMLRKSPNRNSEVQIERQNTNATQALVGWHTDKQRSRVENINDDAYDWVLDIPEVIDRYNSSWHSAIRERPIDVLLSNNVTNATVANRIWNRAYDPTVGIYRDHRTDMRLPGFSPQKGNELGIGDFVRIKTYKSGDMAIGWETIYEASKKLRNKSASDNYSRDIYRITHVKHQMDRRNLYADPVEIPNDARRQQNGHQVKHSRGVYLRTDVNRTYQKDSYGNPLFGGISTYQLENITKRYTTTTPRGYLDRTQILKIPKETVISYYDETSNPKKYVDIQINDYIIKLETDKTVDDSGGDIRGQEDVPIQFEQRNPKKPNTESYERYENYKKAKTISEFHKLHAEYFTTRNLKPRPTSNSDWKNDYARKLIIKTALGAVEAT